MPAVLPPGLTVVGRGQPLARALAVTVLALPLVIATVALVPALIICPFLPAAYRQQVPVLLDSLHHWAASLAPGQRRAGDGHPAPLFRWITATFVSSRGGPAWE
jgi:hypothetical protein